MKYEIILFDADETLFDFKKSEREALKKSMIEFGVNYDEDYHLAIYKDINSKVWSELEKGLISQEKLKTERFKRFFKKLNLDFNILEFAKSYMHHLSNASYLYVESEELLKTLSKKYRLVIITNGLVAVQEKRIRSSSVAHYFEEIIISEEIGVSKPHAYIFEHTLSLIDYNNKEKILMVGDSLTSDITGASNFGIDSCWYNQHGVVNTKDVEPSYEIDKLESLLSIL